MRRPTVFEIFTAFALITLIALAAPARLSAAPLLEAGDASISRSDATGTWTLTAGGTTLTLVLDPARDFAIARLVTASGLSWTSVARPDSAVRVGGQTFQLGNRSAGFALLGVTTSADGDRLRLNATFELASQKLRVTRHYAIASGSPTFEAWTTYEPSGGSLTLSELDALRIALPAGTIHTLTGLRGDNSDVVSDSVFTLQHHLLSNGERLEIGAESRSSESSVPWIAVDGAKDEFFAALMWSGAWSLSAERSGTALTISAGLASTTTTITGAVDGPHVLFGAVPGGLAQASEALRSYVITGLRGGRALRPLVTYNTWFAYGTRVDQASMMAEMERAAMLGTELFVLDAGWYERAGAQGLWDFDSGLGTWKADPGRFPDGLRPLREYAHELGMKFGVWVEPERVDRSMLREAGVDETWLATHDGNYGSDDTALLCLSLPAARRWIESWLDALIAEVQPDYLKWDNNLWVNCDRSGHGHGAEDGNFAQINGLYDVLAAIRERYPDLLIENVSGGGNRLDLGMLRYSDVAWMDDRTAPSIHVRHNLEGLTAAFPPAYLLSFVTDHESEPLRDAADLPLYMRSRMSGVLGLCFRASDVSDADWNVLQREIDIYKSTRGMLISAAGSLLTAQAQPENGPSWDVLQTTAAGSLQAVIWAFQSDDGVNQVRVTPVGLEPTATYVVTSVDSGPLGEATGHALMTDGIDIQQSPISAAHILIIRAQQP
jgi:alpha-galactosidase